MAEKDDNLMAAISYVLGFITGLIVYVMYKDKGNKFVLFHAVQSTILSVIMVAVMIPVSLLLVVLGIVVPALGCILDLLILIPVALVMLAIAVLCILKAYKGEKFKLPAIGDMAEKYAG